MLNKTGKASSDWQSSCEIRRHQRNVPDRDTNISMSILNHWLLERLAWLRLCLSLFSDSEVGGVNGFAIFLVRTLSSPLNGYMFNFFTFHVKQDFEYNICLYRLLLTVFLMREKLSTDKGSNLYHNRASILKAK